MKKEQEGQKLLDWFSSRFNEGLGIRWGIALKGKSKIIGTIGFNNYTKKHRANIGYDLKSSYWNKGYMTEALQAAIEFGFNVLDINRIEAEVMQGNVISERLLKKLNFKREGVLRQWMLWNEQYYDMTMYSLLKMEYNNK
jgi:ribosomal-protein-alanine N-acetyltransferase